MFYWVWVCYSSQTPVHIIHSLTMSCNTDSGPASSPPSALGLSLVFDTREEGCLSLHGSPSSLFRCIMQIHNATVAAFRNNVISK